MATPIIVGSTAGYLGTLNRPVGFILEAEDFDFSTEEVDFPNADGLTVAVATNINPMSNITLKGYMLKDTSFTGTLATTLSLSSTPNFYKSGSSAPGFLLINNIKVSNAVKEFRKLEVSGRNLPGVTL